MITKQDVFDSFDQRSSHLLDRVRETAQRCIALGVRVDLPHYEVDDTISFGAASDFTEACHAALFQLAELNPDASE